MQTIIGIDFSINSTAISIRKGKEIHLFSFVPNYRPELSGFKIHKSIEDFVTVRSYEKSGNTKDPIVDQRIKLQNADNLSNQIIETIEDFIEGDIDIRIEGYSYGSKGNAFIDLITYNTFLKVKLIEKWGHCITIIPPKSLKKIYTGNGNASKCDMVRTYLSSTKSKLQTKLEELNYNKEGEFIIGKPIDDIVDSIALSSIEV